MAGMKRGGMSDSDSESEDGIPPGLQAMSGLPPISGPVVTAAAPRPVSATSGSSEGLGPDAGPQLGVGMSQPVGPDVVSPRVESETPGTDVAGPPEGLMGPQGGEGFAVIQREASESQIEEVSSVERSLC